MAWPYSSCLAVYTIVLSWPHEFPLEPSLCQIVFSGSPVLEDEGQIKLLRLMFHARAQLATPRPLCSRPRGLLTALQLRLDFFYMCSVVFLVWTNFTSPTPAPSLFCSSQILPPSRSSCHHPVYLLEVPMISGAHIMHFIHSVSVH